MLGISAKNLRKGDDFSSMSLDDEAIPDYDAEAAERYGDNSDMCIISHRVLTNPVPDPYYTGSVTFKVEVVTPFGEKNYDRTYWCMADAFVWVHGRQKVPQDLCAENPRETFRGENDHRPLNPSDVPWRDIPGQPDSGQFAQVVAERFNRSLENDFDYAYPKLQDVFARFMDGGRRISSDYFDGDLALKMGEDSRN